MRTWRSSPRSPVSSSLLPCCQQSIVPSSDHRRFVSLLTLFVRRRSLTCRCCTLCRQNSLPILAELVAHYGGSLEGVVATNAPKAIVPIVLSQFSSASAEVRRQAMAVLELVVNKCASVPETVAAAKLLMTELATRGIKPETKQAVLESLNAVARVPHALGAFEEAAQAIIKSLVPLVNNECTYTHRRQAHDTELVASHARLVLVRQRTKVPRACSCRQSVHGPRCCLPFRRLYSSCGRLASARRRRSTSFSIASC